MKKFLLVSLPILLVGSNAFAQDAKPTPAPTPLDDKTVVKVSTSLIQLDVSITDSKGRAVADIKPNEIEIYENGVKQKISGFSFVSLPQPKAEKEAKEKKDAVVIPEAPLVLRP